MEQQMSTENQPEIDIENQDVDQSEQDTDTTQEIDQESTESQIEGLQAALLEAEAKIDAQKDSVIRAKAEADNARKRSIQEVDKARKFALEKFAAELLPILDNLERALQVPNADDEAVKPLIAGVEMTMKLFISTIEKFDLNVVDPQGQSFNPDLHQAMAMQPAEDVAPNTVISVMQKGYTLNGRLLRPALVMVSKAADGGVDTQA
jgi:molecular chaperone GrpE